VSGTAESKSANDSGQRMEAMQAFAMRDAAKAEKPAKAMASSASFAAPAIPASPPSVALADEKQLGLCESATPHAILDVSLFPPNDAWHQGMRELFDQDKADDARRQLRCWQQVYPLAAVPDDLKPLLNH